jgi:hypothetical protein
MLDLVESTWTRVSYRIDLLDSFFGDRFLSYFVLSSPSSVKRVVFQLPLANQQIDMIATNTRDLS